MHQKINSRKFSKDRYYIEPILGINTWVLRKEGTNNFLKRSKFKYTVLNVAGDMLYGKYAELCICDENGLQECIIDFES